MSIKSVLIFFIVVETCAFILYFSGNFGNYNIANILSSGILSGLSLIFILKYSNSIGKINNRELFILLSFSCWFIAEILYGYINGYLQIDAYPSFADLFYVMGYIFFFAFLWLMNKVYKIELAYILSAIITFSLVAFYILYVSIFVYDIHSFSGSEADLTLLFVYPIVDLFIVMGSIIFYLRGRTISLNKEHNFWIFISMGGIIFFVADVIFGFNDLFRILSDENIYLSDLFYNLGYLLFGIAFIVRITHLTFLPDAGNTNSNNPNTRPKNIKKN